MQLNLPDPWIIKGNPNADRNTGLGRVTTPQTQICQGIPEKDLETHSARSRESLRLGLENLWKIFVAFLENLSRESGVQERIYCSSKRIDTAQ